MHSKLLGRFKQVDSSGQSVPLQHSSKSKKKREYNFISIKIRFFLHTMINYPEHARKSSGILESRGGVCVVEFALNISL